MEESAAIKAFLMDKSNSNKIEELLENVLAGYNATAMAYGVTGTGKTFTMFGNEDNVGLSGMCFEYISKSLGNDTISVFL